MICSCSDGLLVIPEARRIRAVPPPPIMGLGNAGGFEMQVEDRGGDSDSRRAAERITGAMIARCAARQPGLQRPSHVVPLGRAAARSSTSTASRPRASGVTPTRSSDHAAGLAGLGLRQRLQQVRPYLPGRMLQADSQFRCQPEDIDDLMVRNRTGEMMPLGDAGDSEADGRAPLIILVQPLSVRDRHRQRAAPASAPAKRSNADGADGRQTLPPRHRLRMDGDVVPGKARRRCQHLLIVFALAVLLVYLVLAGQYESWIAAARGDPGRAAVRCSARSPRVSIGWHGQQPLHPDRHHAAHRAGEQERDPDRRGRPRAPGATASRIMEAARRGGASCGSGRS